MWPANGQEICREVPMKKHLFKVSVLTALCIGLLLPHTTAFAKSPIWLTAGVGLGGVANGESGQNWIGSRLAVSWCQGSGQWTVQTSSCTEFNLFHEAVLHVDPRESVRDLGVLYGKRWSEPGLGFMSISGGVALVYGIRRGEPIAYSGVWWFFGTSYYEKVPFTTVGLPIDMQFCLAPSQGVGLALDLFGNLNSERSYGAATISLIIGKLW
jgi:hypothetical protein